MGRAFREAPCLKARRGAEAMDAAGVLPRFQGWAVHDFWSPYLRYDCLHAFCNAHLLRELKFLFEEQKLAWAGRLMELLREFHGLAKAQPSLSEKLIERCQERYHALLKAARREHPRPAPKAPRAKQSKAANLLDRLEDNDQCILAFLSVPQVPFTNNQAEQDIRMIKVRQKISGSFRTLKGAQVFATIRGFLSTARKQGINLLQALTQAFSGESFLPLASA
jgi:transposase